MYIAAISVRKIDLIALDRYSERLGQLIPEVDLGRHALERDDPVGIGTSRYENADHGQKDPNFWAGPKGFERSWHRKNFATG